MSASLPERSANAGAATASLPVQSANGGEATASLPAQSANAGAATASVVSTPAKHGIAFGPGTGQSRFGPGGVPRQGPCIGLSFPEIRARQGAPGPHNAFWHGVPSGHAIQPGVNWQPGDRTPAEWFARWTRGDA